MHAPATAAAEQRRWAARSGEMRCPRRPASTIVTVPAASPSSPSVRFTALLMPATMMKTRRQVEPWDRRSPCPPTGIVVVSTPRSSRALVSGICTHVDNPPQLTTSRPNTTATTPCQNSLARGRRPSERSCETFDQSSMKPSRPQASIAPSASRLSRVVRPSTRNVAVTTSRIRTPPMVGVPCLTRWPCGPSARTC